MTEEHIERLMQNGITAYFHCAQCLAECPPSMSAAEFARLAFGGTPYGLQVWCIRHNRNIYHLDLTSQPRPACVTHGVEADTPYAPDLSLACPHCGVDPASGQVPTRLDDA
jgi:hypothetical protein